MISAEVIECFEVTGRGTVVVIDSETELPTGRCLEATIHQREGATRKYQAWKEWLLRRSTAPQEDEVFLIVDATVEEIPLGAMITLQFGAT